MNYRESKVRTELRDVQYPETLLDMLNKENTKLFEKINKCNIDGMSDIIFTIEAICEELSTRRPNMTQKQNENFSDLHSDYQAIVIKMEELCVLKER